MDKDPITDQNNQHKCTITMAVNKNIFYSKKFDKILDEKNSWYKFTITVTDDKKDTVGLYYKSF